MRSLLEHRFLEVTMVLAMTGDLNEKSVLDYTSKHLLGKSQWK
jgi:hypothetical protein